MGAQAWGIWIALLPGGERFGQVGRFRWGEGLWLRHERRERLALPSSTRRRDAFRLRLFQNMGRAIEGVLTFHFLGGERVANLFRESSAQRSGLRAFFELPDWTVRPHFVRHIGVDPFGIGFEPIDLGADEAALLSIELACDRDPAPLGN